MANVSCQVTQCTIMMTESIYHWDPYCLLRRSKKYMASLIRHAKHANTVVLGRAVGHKQADECANTIESQLEMHTLMYRVQLDFSGNIFERSETCLKDGTSCPWTLREMVVYSKNNIS